MRFIEHIIEPKRLLLAWQSSDERFRTRYIVGELLLLDGLVQLAYLPETNDFREAQKKGFGSYPAFQDINKIYDNVLDAFMRRLPPRTRGDFPQYLESLRLKPDMQFSNFALLGYSGAKLLSDGFSIIHPFDNVEGPCELLLEAAGYRHIHKAEKSLVQIDSPASFLQEFNEITQEDAIRIHVAGCSIGYVNRGLLPTFFNWIADKRIEGAWVEKLNGTQRKPAVYLFVKIAPKNS